MKPATAVSFVVATGSCNSARAPMACPNQPLYRMHPLLSAPALQEPGMVSAFHQLRARAPTQPPDEKSTIGQSGSSGQAEYLAHSETLRNVHAMFSFCNVGSIWYPMRFILRQRSVASRRAVVRAGQCQRINAQERARTRTGQMAPCGPSAAFQLRRATASKGSSRRPGAAEFWQSYMKVSGN